MPTAPTFKIVSIDADPNSIYPSIRIQVNGQLQNANSNDTVYIEGTQLELAAVSQNGVESNLPTVPSEQTFFWVRNFEQGITFKLNLDHFGISQLEKIRSNQNLRFRGRLNLTMSADGIPKQNHQATVDYTLPKSTWVEEILPRLKFKNVFLLEIPTLISTSETAEIIKHVSDSSTKFSMGDYTGSMVQCHKALEATLNLLRTKDLIREVKREDGTLAYIEPKFSGFTDSESIKTALEKSWSGAWGYPQAGARHLGRDRGKEEAHFQMLTTYGLINVIITHLEQNP